jgi:hypothetical protein
VTRLCFAFPSADPRDHGLPAGQGCRQVQGALLPLPLHALRPRRRQRPTSSRSPSRQVRSPSGCASRVPTGLVRDDLIAYKCILSCSLPSCALTVTIAICTSCSESSLDLPMLVIVNLKLVHALYQKSHS